MATTVGSSAVEPAADRPRRHAARCKGALTRERILRAGCEAFIQRGYGGATFERVAEYAGVSRPGVNFHFRERTALFREIVSCSVAPKLSAALKHSQPGPCAWNQISTFVTAIADTADRDVTALTLVSVLDSLRHPSLVDDDLNALQLARTLLAETLEQAASNHELRSGDIDATVEMLLAVIWGMVFHAGYLAGQGTPPATEAFAALVAGDLWHYHGTAPRIPVVCPPPQR